MEPEPLYHLALAADWDAAVAAGSYTMSTVGRTLEEEGFIHLSRGRQIAATAARFYRNRRDVVLVTLDPARLAPEVREEPVGDDTFPHLYGPLDPAAAVAVTPLPLGADGVVVVPPGLGFEAGSR
ncbi:DUF952 domain-containing protein [Acidiferrimicrobium sp. IK]|uniref:DUF952 domain-containing protein n=1 Tax=Acidiferrimicrobium sp. IK TaxID=2871700 RepID=UPI0021CB715E|nr:DUF952 domain-containing protein [Acidiferrimicrobium sp. IK]MCU4183948.1 DUF952 domain-containing protein [Acidiferrimicrobium sp. IK]